MQTWAKPWAKRGVQAALVTGGMLAAGTGVASAADHCPDRPAPPLGDSALSPANSPSLRHGVPCFAGELFPESELPGHHVNAPLTSRAAKHPITALSGTLDPHSPTPAPSSNPSEDNLGDTSRTADRNTDIQPGDTEILFGLVPLPGAEERQVPSGTPSQGFHRSLSWSGPIGDVIGDAPRDDLADTLPNRPTGLIRPSADPATFHGFAEPDGIVELWQGALGRALLAPETVDLTAADLTGPRPDFHTVPAELLNSSTERVATSAPQREFVPLEVPGEHQLKADEIPDLLGTLAMLDVSKAPETVERGEDSSLHAPLPFGAELNALDGGESSVPVISNITKALEGGPAERAPEPTFTQNPLRSDVVVSTVDELAAATPTRNLVAQNPFPTGPRAATMPEMRLPRGDSGLLPNLTAVQGETLPTPEVGDVLNSLAHTTPIPRITDIEQQSSKTNA